jgi:hypothetical protein
MKKKKRGPLKRYALNFGLEYNCESPEAALEAFRKLFIPDIGKLLRPRHVKRTWRQRRRKRK